MKQSQSKTNDWVPIGSFALLLLGAISIATTFFEVTLILEEGWEQPIRKGKVWKKSGNAWGDQYRKRVLAPVRTGKYSLRITLDLYESEKTHRTEIRFDDPKEFKIGEEYWLGESIFLPADFIPGILPVDIARLRDLGDRKITFRTIRIDVQYGLAVFLLGGFYEKEEFTPFVKVRRFSVRPDIFLA